MVIKVDGESFDMEDPRKRAEAIRRWLKKKAEEKTFNLPDVPAKPREQEPTPGRPMAALPQ